MKTKKVLLIIPLLFLIIGMGGCEDNEPQYEIYENHEISACGVEDPLKNIEWLKIICNEIVLTKRNIHLSFSIDLYETKETKEHVILIPYSPNKGIFNYNVYDCSGKVTIYHAGPTGEIISVPPQYPLYQYCEYVGTLWSLTKKNRKI